MLTSSAKHHARFCAIQACNSLYIQSLRVMGGTTKYKMTSTPKKYLKSKTDRRSTVDFLWQSKLLRINDTLPPSLFGLSMAAGAKKRLSKHWAGCCFCQGEPRRGCLGHATLGTGFWQRGVGFAEATKGTYKQLWYWRKEACRNYLPNCWAFWSYTVFFFKV